MNYEYTNFYEFFKIPIYLHKIIYFSTFKSLLNRSHIFQNVRLAATVHFPSVVVNTCHNSSNTQFRLQSLALGVCVTQLLWFACSVCFCLIINFICKCLSFRLHFVFFPPSRPPIYASMRALLHITYTHTLLATYS